MRRSRRLGLLSVVLVVLAVACTPLPTPYPYRSALKTTSRPPVTLIGDSTMAAMLRYDASGATRSKAILDAGYRSVIDAYSCRRLIVRSCGRTYQTPNTLAIMRARAGTLGEAVVIMAGYDDVAMAPAIEGIMAEALKQGVPHVVWLNYPENVPYLLPGGLPARSLYTGFNADLRAGDARYPTLHVADWNGYSNPHRDWFSSDGIHLTPTGTNELAKFIKAHLDSLPLGRCLPAETVGSAPSGGPFAYPAQVAMVPAAQRLIDTRPGDADRAVQKIGAGKMAFVSLAAVPPDATVVDVKLTAVEPCTAGQVRMAACGIDPRTAHAASFVAGGTATLARKLARSKGANLCVWSSASTDVVVDLVAWGPAQPATTAPLTEATTTLPPTSAPTTAAAGPASSSSTVPTTAPAPTGTPTTAAATTVVTATT